MDQGSMDPLFGPGPWTPCHGPGPWTFFFIFIRRFCTRSMDTPKTEIEPKKDLTRRCRPMLTSDHKYLVVLT